MLRVAEREWITLALELLNDPSLVDYCLGDDEVGEQLVGNNRLFLVHRAIGPKDAVASEVQMRGEIVKMLRLGDGRVLRLLPPAACGIVDDVLNRLLKPGDLRPRTPSTIEKRAEVPILTISPQESPDARTRQSQRVTNFATAASLTSPSPTNSRTSAARSRARRHSGESTSGSLLGALVPEDNCCAMNFALFTS
jgi:hypothetical protein